MLSTSMKAFLARTGPDQFMQEMRVRFGLDFATKCRRYCRELQSMLSDRVSMAVIGGYVACGDGATAIAQAACGIWDSMC
jgi:hypothetical protein